jgi:tetratricopeptide (TPR) repeat protein
VSDAVYERYKEALRRGHVAALRGRLEEALDAYAEAASIATERPLPYTSIGAVQLRQGRVDDALASFGAALQRAPRDEAALAGRAEALTRAGRSAEAAEALDLVAGIQAAADRPLDALDSARRALELAESRQRRREVAILVEAVRGTDRGLDAEAAIARAMRVLETTEPAPADGEAGAAGPPAAERSAEADAEASALPPEPPPPDPAALALDADEALDAGDLRRTRDSLLALGAVHAAAGHGDAALDACYRALAVAPDDPDLHLALVDLYLARGWRALATEKLTLLARLVSLDGDEAIVERVRSAAEAADSDGRRRPAG